LPCAAAGAGARRSRKLERSADFSHAHRNLLPSAGTSGRFYWKHSITDPHAGGRTAISMVIRPAERRERRAVPITPITGVRLVGVPGDSLILVLPESAIISGPHLAGTANLWQM
jgi:hypothetical protein